MRGMTVRAEEVQSGDHALIPGGVNAWGEVIDSVPVASAPGTWLLWVRYFGRSRGLHLTSATAWVRILRPDGCHCA